MKVMLLGATGLLGHNVLQQLTDSGHEVVAVVRRHSALRINPPCTTVVEDDITCLNTLITAATGCDAIVNCAGVTDMSLPHYKDYSDVNIVLCLSIANAMNRLGIQRLVHVSTVNTIGYGSAEHPSDELAEIREPFILSHYANSKYHGELAILDEANRHPDSHIVVINPGFMIGPMDVKPSSGRMLLAGYRRRLMLAPRGGKAFVDVRDVATAVVNALTMGRNGQRYIAVNRQGHLTIKELYQLQAAVMGYRQTVLTLPNWLLLTAGALGEVLRAMGVRTDLSLCNVRQLMVREHYDNSLARTELQLPESDLGKAIADFHRWRSENVMNK